MHRDKPPTADPPCSNEAYPIATHPKTFNATDGQ